MTWTRKVLLSSAISLTLAGPATVGIAPAQAENARSDRDGLTPTQALFAEELRGLIVDVDRIDSVVADAILSVLAATPPERPYDTPGAIWIYQAAIQTGACHLAEATLLTDYVAKQRGFDLLKTDAGLRNRWLRDVASKTVPELTACVFASQARLYNSMIEAANLPPLPFQSHDEALFDAPFDLYNARDERVSNLIVLSETYAPAGALVARFSLEERFVDLPDDLTLMMLLRADASWPDDPTESPLPISRSETKAMISGLEATLPPNVVAHAHETWDTDAYWMRLSWGDD
ncbi:MAG: hypothetical protein AAFX39_04805 [Pseudomonadota bacterium]